MFKPGDEVYCVAWHETGFGGFSNHIHIFKAKVRHASDSFCPGFRVIPESVPQDLAQTDTRWDRGVEDQYVHADMEKAKAFSLGLLERYKEHVLRELNREIAQYK